MRARVSVPATSANLGPGFDCFGLALDLLDDVDGRHGRDAGGSVAGGGRGRAPDRSDGPDQRGDGAARPAVRPASSSLRSLGDEPDPAGPRARLVVGRGGGRHRARVRAARPGGARGSRLGVRARRRDRGPSRQRGARGLRRVHRRHAGRLGASLRSPPGAAAGPARPGLARGDRRRALGVTGVGRARRRRLQRGARGAHGRGVDARSVAAGRRVARPAAPAAAARDGRGGRARDRGRRRGARPPPAPVVPVRCRPQRAGVRTDRAVRTLALLGVGSEWRILRPGVRTTGFEVLVEP